MLSARKICAPASIRHASYSKNPQKKTGSFDDLIYNDALARGQRPGQKRVASGWNVERTPKQSTDPLQVPDHRFPWQGVPNPLGPFVTGETGYQGHDRGRFMGQSVRYEEILPRCEGKLSPLKWKNLTEEDRYTQRAWRIREGLKISISQKFNPF